MAGAPWQTRHSAPARAPGPDAGAGYRTQGAAPADRRGQQVRVRASSARPTPGDGDAGGDDQADGRAPARARRRPPMRWVRVRPAAPLDPDRRQRLGTPGRRSTSKRRDCRSGRGGRAVRPSTGATAQRGRGRAGLFPTRRPPSTSFAALAARRRAVELRTMKLVSIDILSRARIRVVGRPGGTGRAGGIARGRRQRFGPMIEASASRVGCSRSVETKRRTLA